MGIPNLCPHVFRHVFLRRNPRAVLAFGISNHHDSVHEQLAPIAVAYEQVICARRKRFRYHFALVPFARQLVRKSEEIVSISIQIEGTAIRPCHPAALARLLAPNDRREGRQQQE